MYARRSVAQIVAVLAALVACLSAPAQAQQYRVDPVNKALSGQKVVVQDALNNPTAYAAIKDGPLAEFFTKYYFPLMTQTEPPDVLFKLAGTREELFKRFLLATNNPDVQKQLTDLTYAAMGPIVVSAPGNPPQPPYHPAVRLNAVLILGMLDDAYPAGNNPEKPMLKANNGLSSIVDSATTKSPFPPALVLGAIIGLERHAQLKQSLPKPAIDKMQAAMVKLIMQDQPIQNMKAEEYDWLRLRAGSVLAQLGTVGTDNQAFNAVLHLVAKLESIDDRCDAAVLFANGKWTFEGAKVDGAATAATMLRLAVDVSAAEFAQALDFEDKQSSGFAAIGINTRVQGRSTRERDTGPTTTAETKEGYPRRPLVTHLLWLRQGINATRPLVATEMQAKFKEVVAAIDTVIQQASDKESVDRSVTEAVRTMATAIGKLAPPAAPAAAATAPTPDSK